MIDGPMLAGHPAALSPNKAAFAGRRVLLLTRDLRHRMMPCSFPAAGFDGVVIVREKFWIERFPRSLNRGKSLSERNFG